MFKAEIYDKIISFLSNNHSNKFLLQSQIFHLLKIDKEDAAIFNKTFSEIVQEEFIERKNKKIRFNSDYRLGYVQFLADSKPYVYIKNKKFLMDIKEANNLLHGDKIIVKIDDKYLLKCSFVKLLKHKASKVRGTIMDNKNFAFLIPDDNVKFPCDLFINKGKSKIQVESYDRVIGIVNEYDLKDKPRANILYKMDELTDEINNLDMIIEKYKIQKEFPSEVLHKSSKIKNGVSYTNHLKRVNLTEEVIFTIDGEDAKDLDDAISIKKYGNNYELGVYIADVSNYVEEGSVIDKNAFERGTSYYFINKVIPMLPVELSNGVCSLCPDQKRVCIGIKMIINENGEILDRDFFECIIKSKRKCSYEEINDYLNGVDNDFAKADKEILDSISLGMELSSILYQKRFNRGALVFDYDEIDFKLDENDHVISIDRHNRGKSNKMIEEFMIAANETVAKLFTELGFPTIYRVHDEPFSEKLENFVEICKTFNLDVSKIDVENINQKELSKLLKSINDKNLRKSLGLNLITTMKQAKYSSENIGHFGLASDNYCHFTSPIRRYPDLFVHRILKRYIRRILNNDVLKQYIKDLVGKVSNHCSYTERNANKAEEEYDRLKTFEYLNENTNEEYEGLIYSVSEKGLYILINNCITGYIRLKGATYNNEDFSLEYDNKVYKIGDLVNVLFLEMDVKDNRLLFGFVGNKQEDEK